MPLRKEDMHDERQFKALTGVSHKEFQQLLPVFTTSYQELQQARYAASRTRVNASLGRDKKANCRP